MGINDDGKVDISNYNNRFNSLFDIEILQKDVDEIFMADDEEHLRIEKNIKANTIIFITDRYTRNNAKKLNIDYDLVYTQDEMPKLLKFVNEYYQKVHSKQSCECGSDMCNDVPNC